jgi:imidazolonepropionase
MNELNIIDNGAVLIRNGVIEDIGPSRRVENLAAAKTAKEIDACGGVVMPGFVDPDAVLVFPVVSGKSDKHSPLRVLSIRRLEASALEAAADWTRYGTLTVGAHTGYAFDLRNALKVLRIHKICQSKPLRIRSVFSPQISARSEAADAEKYATALIEKWLPAVRRRKLAAIVEFTVDNSGMPLALERVRKAAVAAAGLGYSIRIRTHELSDTAARDLAVEAGAVAFIAPVNSTASYDGRLADSGCVQILSATDALADDRGQAKAIRQALDEGAALALASSYSLTEKVSFNSQFLLHLACDRFGMTAQEAIVAATYNAACALRMSHVTGSLEPGKSADAVVMDLSDYRELPRRAGHTDLRFAIRAGNIVFRRAPLILD